MATYLGTTINESPTIVVTAGADIKVAQGKAVMLTKGKATTPTAGANVIGIIPLSEDEEIKNGSDFTVQVKDIGAWVASEKIEVGDELTTDANGCAAKVQNGNFITAIALTAAEKAGTIIRVQLIKAGYKPTA